MNQALRGEPFTIFGDGEQQRAFTYVGDIAPVIARAPDYLTARGRVFNLGADKVSTLNELARVVAEVMHVELRVRHLPARNEVIAAFSNHALAREVFGVQPETSLVEGLGRMAQWARRHGRQEPTVFDGLDLVDGLPPSWAAVARA
jgi:UDP-glucose 4-epimerase